MGIKTTVWIFTLTDEISHENTSIWQGKVKFTQEAESILLGAQNNAIRTSKNR